MGHPSLLFITLLMSFSSPGSLIQTSHLLDNSRSVRLTQSEDRSINAKDRLSREATFHSVSVSDSTVDSRTSQNTAFLKESEQTSAENTSGVTTPTPVITLHDVQAHDQESDKGDTSNAGQAQSSEHVISEEAPIEDSHTTAEKHIKDSHTSVNEDFMHGEENPEYPVQTNVFSSMSNRNMSGSRNPCVQAHRPCLVLKSFNGTSLLWDDMSRTLAFAWELHVFGSASLFILLAFLGVLGTVGACTCPRPLSDALTVTNGLLIMCGTLRGVLLLLDPYGTRQLLSRATLAALHNIPVQLLLWAQVALALVSLKGLKLLLLPLKLHCPWVVGGFAISQCITLLVADLCAPVFSPALPLLLQTLSLCWGLPFCIEVLTKCLSHSHPFVRSSVPQWVPSQRIERRAKRVTVVCAFFGALCCSIHMYSLLWLYGLLGNWKRFGWGWWLSQFWARILELAWGVSLLFLGSWVFWMPCKNNLKGDQWLGRSEVFKGVDKKSLWSTVLARLRRGPLRKSEKTWEDLMPNNWAKYNLSRAGISKNVMCPYDDQPSTMMPEYKHDPVSCSSSDSQAALLWQKVSERECVLSLIEFDMRPPSPINLRRSIDYALHRGQLATGGLVTPPPLSWSHTLDTDTVPTDGDSGTTFLPAYVGYSWMLDTESISISFDHFQAKDPIQPSSTATDFTGVIRSPSFGEEFSSMFSALRFQHDWSDNDDDVTDL